MFKFILIITLYIFLAFFGSLNALAEQPEISTKKNVKNMTDSLVKIKNRLTVRTSEIDGRLQVRVGLPENMDRAFVVKNFKIIIKTFPINDSANSDYNTVPSAPFILGNTLFSEAQVKKGFLYEVIVNYPVEIDKNLIETCIIREISSDPFRFSKDKNVGKIFFNLPDGIRFKQISDRELLIENVSCALLSNIIKPYPLSEQVVLQYDPFQHSIYLRFSKGLASWDISENSLCKVLPNIADIISLYKKEGNNSITIKDVEKDAGHLDPVIAKKKILQKQKENKIFYEPYISWGKKGFTKDKLYNPGDVAIDKYGFVYVVDTFNHQIKKFKLHYSLDKVFGRHGKQPGQFIKPCSIAIGPEELIYVADMMNNRIQVFDINGKFVRTWGSYGKENGQLANPLAIEVNKNGTVYVADMNNRITLFNSSGKYIDVFGRGGSKKGEFRCPSALAHDNETGFLYIADQNNNRIQALYKSKIKKIFKTIKGLSGGLFSPTGVDICGKNLYIADSGNSRLVVLDKLTGKLRGVYGKKGSEAGEFSGMRGIAAMNNSLVFIIDRYNNRLQVLKRKQK